MRKEKSLALVIMVFLSLGLLTKGQLALAVDGDATKPNREHPGLTGEQAQPFVGQDLHISGAKLLSYQLGTGEYILVFEDGFSMSIGANHFSSDSAVVWLESVTIESRGRVRIDVNAKVYLAGNISVERAKGAKTTDLSQTVIKEGDAMVIQFGVGGEVFVTADKREIVDPRELELYKKAVAAVGPPGPKFIVQPEALVPELPAEEIKPAKPAGETAAKKPVEPKKVKVEKKHEVKPVEPVKPAEEVTKPKVKGPTFRYPVYIAPAGKVAPAWEWTKGPNDIDTATVIGRFYLWQKRNEEGGLLELQADNAVVWYRKQQFDVNQTSPRTDKGEDVLAKGNVTAIYLAGDVVMTEGQRTIRADEMYYDFQNSKALAVNAVMRSFDAQRGIPIYVRAARLRRLAEDKFAAENVTVTSSEFYQPQISMTASSVIITDTTVIDQQQDKVSDSSYDAQMRDVRLKSGNQTIFYWPFVRSNLERPDVPLKSVQTGHDSIWGTFVETRWYLARLLGLRETGDTESTLALDYYGKRGLGSGAEIDYKTEDYFGNVSGYIIRDTGEDRLGRTSDRKDLEPPRELRGRFQFQHRQFLPYNWQLTTEVSYLSDKNFLESYYRNEFNSGKAPETLVQLKRIEDNWGLSILGKTRINNFENKLEELPTVEYHLTGQSLFEDKLTFYSDNQLSRFRQRFGSESTHTVPEQFYPFATSRNELDVPTRLGSVKVVPFVAGTFGYEDQLGFHTDLGGTAGDRADSVWLGEAGVRASQQAYWKVYPNVKSRLWDLNGLRHIIEPELTAVSYTASDSVFEQRDVLNLGISQRLQTKRRRSSLVYPESSLDKQAPRYETVDWMELNTDITWVDPSGDTSAGPDRFIWNKPFIPLQKRLSTDKFGPRRNYFGADYIWRLSDTLAILSDMNFDIQSGVVQQFNIGFSRLCWPNLSYYIGSRYLRRVQVLDEKGSNAFVFAFTYVLDPRYTIVFSEQYDFDYGANIQSDITLIRRYHRMCWGITYSADESLERTAIVFSIWPQGVSELAIGSRRYLGLVDSPGY